MKNIFLLLLFSIIILPIHAKKKYPKVIIVTNEGKIQIELYNDTPLHSANFVKLVNEGYYNNQLFHRVIKDFMIQTGDPNSKNAQQGTMLGMGGPAYKIPSEITSIHFHKKGVIAAARQGDNVNPKRESNGSQFYIVAGQVFSKEKLLNMEKNGNHKPFSNEEIIAYTTIGGTPHLDDQYTIFGEISRGIKVLNIIEKVQTDKNNRPINDIIIIKAYTKKKWL